MRPCGWALTGYTAALLFTVTAATLAFEGFGETSLRSLVRTTARISVTLFLLAFTASSLHRRVRSAFTAWLLKNRRYVGVSFALSHGVHLALLVALTVVYPETMREELTTARLVGGGIAYAFIALMAATSSNAAVRWLGARRWSLLHTIGAYYIWLLFARSYVRRVLESPAYLLPAVFVVLALVLRLTSRKDPKVTTSVTE